MAMTRYYLYNICTVQQISSKYIKRLNFTSKDSITRGNTRVT